MLADIQGGAILKHPRISIGVRKNLRISRGVDDSKKEYPQQGVRIFSGKSPMLVDKNIDKNKMKNNNK